IEILPMKHVANWALNIAAQRGTSYADVRIVAQRSRALTTKNGKVGSASDAESVGMSVRAIADGAWGFAASAEWGVALSRRLLPGQWTSLAPQRESSRRMCVLPRKSLQLRSGARRIELIRSPSPSNKILGCC